MTDKDGTATIADAELGSGKEGTPKEAFTREEVTKMVMDAKTSVLADAKRFQVEAGKALKAATAAQERLEKLEQARIDAELEANKDDPAEIRRIRAEQKASKAETELAEKIQELNERTDRLTKLEAGQAELARTQTATEIAARLKVDPARLVKLSKFTDGSSEAIEDIAKDLPKVTTQPGLKPDSNRGMGGNLSWDNVRNAYIQDPYNLVNKQRYLEMKAQQTQ